MPMAIPLVAAAFEAYAGATAIAAGVEGLAAVAAGLEVAGAALTVVGTVSGNKNLSMLGTIAGLGGGLASFASSSMTASTQAAAAASDAGGGSIAAPLEDAASGTAAAGIAAPVGESAGLVSGANPALDEAGQNLAGNAPGDALDQGIINSSQSPVANVTAPATPAGPSAPAAPSAGTQAANAFPDTGTTTGPGSPGTSSSSAPGQSGAVGAPAQVSSAPANQSWFGKLQDTLGSGADWAQKNPVLTKVGAGLVQGAMGYYGSQQLAEDNLKRAKGYQDWVRQRYSDSVRNISVPTPTVAQGSGSGIIAGARS